MADDANLSEELDDEVIGEEYPPERPLGVDEDQVEDSLADRVKRERPDYLGEDVGRVGTLVDDGGPDVEADAVADEVAPGMRRDQLDAEDDFTRESSVQDREEVIPAEEAAMHLTEDPPMGDGDGYLEE